MIYILLFAVIFLMMGVAYFTWALLTGEPFRFLVSCFLFVLAVLTVFVEREVSRAYDKILKLLVDR